MRSAGGGSSATSPLRTLHVPFASQFTVLTYIPRWFSVVMGTGIVSLLLNTLPYNGPWLYWISVAIFVLNVLLFTAGSLITLLRYVLYPEIFHVMIVHPVQSLFLGTFPMGMATIINMFCNVCVPAWGEWARYFAWGMWMVDAFLSVLTALSLPFIMWVTHTKKRPTQCSN